MSRYVFCQENVLTEGTSEQLLNASAYVVWYAYDTYALVSQVLHVTGWFFWQGPANSFLVRRRTIRFTICSNRTALCKQTETGHEFNFQLFGVGSSSFKFLNHFRVTEDDCELEVLTLRYSLARESGLTACRHDCPCSWPRPAHP